MLVQCREGGEARKDGLQCWRYFDLCRTVMQRCAKRQDRVTREDQRQFEQSLGVEDDGEQADWTANYVLPNELDLTTGS